jgi:hypothetical protein
VGLTRILLKRQIKAYNIYSYAQITASLPWPFGACPPSPLTLLQPSWTAQVRAWLPIHVPGLELKLFKTGLIAASL